MNPRDALNDLYEQAMSLYDGESRPPTLESKYEQDCQTIIDRQDGNRAVLTVLITLLLKKTLDPAQDIRLHQAQMEGGFSGRSLDTSEVTPFMKDMSFPAMSESGWLTS